MDAVELDLFTAWYELVVRGETARELALEAVNPLGTILEALLRVREFEVFELAVGLLARTPLPESQRRDVLGELYLRRGFMASAAEEWLAVCAVDPQDVHALWGLARVAERQGMPAEARDFAQATLGVAAEHAGACALLERLPAVVEQRAAA